MLFLDWNIISFPISNQFFQWRLVSKRRKYEFLWLVVVFMTNHSIGDRFHLLSQVCCVPRKYTVSLLGKSIWCISSKEDSFFRRVFIFSNWRHCGETVVKNHMILSGNTPSLQIKDQKDFAGVNGAQSKEHTSSWSWLPSRQFLPRLKSWAKNIHWTSPSAKISQSMSGNCASSVEISWAKGMIIWCMIVKVHSISNCHRPKCAVDPSFPMTGSMENHRACQPCQILF